MNKIKKSLIALLFIVASIFFVIPVYADTPYVEDDYGGLTSAEIEELNRLARTYSDEYNCGIYVRLKADYSNDITNVEDYSEYIFNSEEMGVGETKDGVMLLYVMSDRNYYISAYGDNGSAAFTDYGKEKLDDHFLSYLSSGDYNVAFTTFINDSAYYLDEYQKGEPIDVPNVEDDYGGLTSTEIEELNRLARTYSDEYDCGIYVRLKADYSNDITNVEDYAEYIFNSEEMGVGETKDGVLLLIVMSDRSYDIAAHGDNGNAAFTDYGKEELADHFLSYLSNGDYNAAFTTFINDSAYYLGEYQNGEPVDVPEGNPYIPIGAAAAIGIVVSAIVTAVKAGKHKTKGQKFEATNYIVPEGTSLTNSRDVFLYKTETRTKIAKDSGGSSSSGGTTVNDSGFSHSSGHF